MMVQTTTQASQSNLLRRTLQANAIFSSLSGVIMSVASAPLAEFLGLTAPIVLVAFGVSLILFAAALFYLASQEEINRTVAFAIFDLDVAWVIGSWIILLAGLVSFSAAGWWAVAIVADIVTIFAVMEYIGLRRMK